MDFIFQDFGSAFDRSCKSPGYTLAETLSPDLAPETMQIIWRSTNYHDARSYIRRNLNNSLPHKVKLSKDELDGWADIYFSYWKTAGEILGVQGQGGAPDGKSSWAKVYETWKEMTSHLIRGYQSYGFEAWTIPCLYITGKYLRVFSIKADAERDGSSADNGEAVFQDDFDPEAEQHKHLEDCARQLNRIFNLCLNDRASLDESRKWGIYYIINLLFKTYFKLNQASLSRNVLKALGAYKGDMPALDGFPKSQRVTFKYYQGVLLFLEENYVEAEKHLTEAWDLCHKDAKRNKELILTYLIPCHLLTTHTLPTRQLLEPYPRLQKLFLNLSQAIKKGELQAFDLALQEGEDEFVKRRIYLTLERGRDIALRNLLRKVFIAGGFEEPKEPGAAPLRRTRIPLAEFVAAISLGSKQQLDTDEVECLLANMIYKGLMKGYIAREKAFVVLSKTGAFPGTGV